MFRGRVALNQAVDLNVAEDPKFQTLMSDWGKAHGASKIMMEVIPHDRRIIGIVFENCILTENDEADEEGFFHIGDYKAYPAEGVFLIQDYEVHNMHNPLAKLIEDIAKSNDMSSKEVKKIMQMTVGEFCEILDSLAPETPAESFNLPKQTVLSAPGRVRCYKCGHVGLMLLDGHLVCRECGHDFGDIDLLGETI